MTNSSNQARGLLLAAIGGLALTADIPLIRLAEGEAWSVLAVRSFTTFAAAIAIWLVWRAFSDQAPALVPGKAGLAVATLYGFGSITFITAVYSTSTANLVFILAFNTMFSALLARVFLGEKLRTATMIAMAAMIVGVAIIVWDSIGTGNLFGDFMALCSAFLIASAITITRSSDREMGFTPLVGVILPALVALVFVADGGYRIDVPWWIILNGVVLMPLAFFCLGSAPRYIPGGEVAMFYLLETVLAPVWVWLIFSERPTIASLIGGTILIVSLVLHSLWQLHEGRRSRREPMQLPL